MQTLHSRSDLECIDFPVVSPCSLPTTPDLTNLAIFSDTSGVAAVPLPRGVEHALEQLNTILSAAPRVLSSSVTPEIRLPLSTADNDTRHACIEALSKELTALYYQEPNSHVEQQRTPSIQSEYFQYSVPTWYRCLSIVCEHFRDIASQLRHTGHSRCFIAGTRNSFADHFHVHDFYTYILYCGRDAGTEVILGNLESNHLTLEQRKDTWKRHTHRVQGISSPPPASYTSDTSHGLLIPPLIAHRACRPALAHSGANANLALVMTLFRGDDEGSPEHTVK